MRTFKVIPKICLASFFFLFSISGFASNIEWSGLYRIEGYSIKNSELNSNNRQKDYGLHHLILKPKVVAADGLTIFGKLHLFNSSSYQNTQMGQKFGNEVNSTGTAANANDSSSSAQANKAEDIVISQMYLSYVHEYGQVIAGRAPIHFGLGMYHNSGMGLFDHFYDSRDMVGYKIIMGNMWFMPSIAKLREGAFNRSDDVTDFLVQFQYDNPENDMEMGLFWQIRKSGDQGSDGPLGSGTSANYFGATATAGAIGSEDINIYAKKDTERWMLGLEAGFKKGDIGVIDPNGNKVGQNGFGLALESAYRPQEGNSTFSFKAGYASGDDTTTSNDFEGYFFDRNYNVGFLLMNHTLGQQDFFLTRLNGGGPNTSGENDQADVETVSNVLYVAPSMNYRWNDRWSTDLTLVTGTLQEDAVTGQKSKDLGYEVDVSLNFNPKKGITWVNEVGLLLPGEAFKGDGSNKSSFGYGLVSKAAISF